MKRSRSPIVVDSRAATLRRRIRAHLRRLGFTKAQDGTLTPPNVEKDGYRELHAPQRAERIRAEKKFLEQKSKSLIQHFAEGAEIDVGRACFRLECIDSGTWQ